MPVLPRSADGTAKPHAPISPETIRVLALLLAGMGVLFAFASPAHADPNRSTELKLSGLEAMVDRVVPKQLTEGKIPGAVVTVVAGGETVFTRGYGVADVDSEVPMDPETTQLPTASVGKLFTATAALQLVREGKLDLNADVNQYLDDFSVPDAYPGQPVTLHHLLTYTSGFDNDIYGWAQWGADEMPSLADFTARAQPKRIRPPGELVAYNNYDFVLTGRLIEIASGQPFADYVAEHVFDPVGMSATAIQGNHDQGSDVATTYRPDGDTQVETAGLHSPATPTGGDMITTGGDLARFMIAQLDQDAALGQDVTRQMQSQQFTAEPRIPGMGYAFEQRPRNGQPIVAKDGDLPGIHHNLALIPEAGLGIHVAYNGDGVGEWLSGTPKT